MDRKPDNFRRTASDAVANVADQRHSFAPAKSVKEMSDDEFDTWMESLPPTPGLPCTDDEIEAAEARAMEDYREGRSYSHEIVSRWLMTWGKPGRKSFFAWLADQDG